MTYSEMRSCYEVMKERNREIVIGSTSVWNPTTFVESVKKLHKTEVAEKITEQSHRSSVMPRGSIARPSIMRPISSMGKKGGSRESLIVDDSGGTRPSVRASTIRGLRGMTIRKKHARE